MQPMSTSMLVGEKGRGREWHARAVVRELLLVGTLFALYRSGRSLTNGEFDRALSNAAHVIRLERALGVFNEQSVQGWVLGSRGLVSGLNRYYVSVHFPVTIAFLVWAYVRHYRSYTFIRTWFAIVTFLALAIHVGFPLAPPRMTSGFVDTLQQYGPRIYTVDPSRSVANQFAAMPSLHFGWALMLAVSVVTIRRTRRSLLIFLHPFVTLLAIVGTANHFWFDAAVAGLLAAAVGLLLLARRLRRPPVDEAADDLDTLGPVHGPPLHLVRSRAASSGAATDHVDVWADGALA